MNTKQGTYSSTLISVSCNIKPPCLLDSFQRFRRTYYLHRHSLLPCVCQQQVPLQCLSNYMASKIKQKNLIIHPREILFLFFTYIPFILIIIKVLFHPPNEPHQCILTHFNNCNFSKAQIVCSLMMVFHTETCRSFSM